MQDSAAPHTGYAPKRKVRWGTLVLVGLLHVAAFLGLLRAFAPQFTADVVDTATSLVTVTITAPPDPEPAPSAAPDSGSAREEGRKATPREVQAPETPLPRPVQAPRTSSTGSATNSGVQDQGVGTGAGGAGEGTGSGNSGTGQGGGARPLELISGSISNARDYPRAGREARRGHDVVVELTVGTNGRVTACRITDPSPDPEADAITCRLATARFVFRPRLDTSGDPMVGIYRWRQRWF